MDDSSKKKAELSDNEKIESSITPQENATVEAIIKVLPKESINPSVKKKLSEIVSTTLLVSSPTPPPEYIQAYEAYYPGSTKILLQNTIEESVHRRKMEMARLEADKDLQRKALDYSYHVKMAPFRNV